MNKYYLYEIVIIFNFNIIFIGNGHDEFISITVVKKKNKDNDKGNVRGSIFSINNDLWEVDIILKCSYLIYLWNYQTIYHSYPFYNLENRS